jgi:aspartate racemase
MKTIGILGGMSWESSADYYRLINEEVSRRLGGLHSASLLLRSLDFEAVESLQSQGSWTQAGSLLAAEAGALEAGGAQALLVASNTMHKVAPRIEKAISIPFLHIADAARAAVADAGLRKLGLLGTRYTMEEDFLIRRLRGETAEAGDVTKGKRLDVVVPQAPDRSEVHRIIFEELVVGRLDPGSRRRLRAIIERLLTAGCDGIVLACTELGLLVKEAEVDCPLFDTTRIHCLAAVDFALGGC